MSENYLFIGSEENTVNQKIFEDHLLKKEKIFILLDENTKEHCLSVLYYIFPVLQDSIILEIKSGEENKTLTTSSNIWSKLSNYGADRTSILLNLGGGVICDLGGFSASVFKRGIRFYNFPTTLLSQVDAAIGGKTGIDFDGLKNQIGLFSNAEKTFIYTAFLKSLNHRQFKSGFAEILKIALISDAGLLSKIWPIKSINYPLPDEIIQAALEKKISISSRDFTEKGERKLLNFGHTLGHAIESLSLQSSHSVLHGEAVAAGIICESFISLKRGLIHTDLYNTLSTYILSHFGKLPISDSQIPSLIKLVTHDKKNRAGNINFTLVCGEGKGVYDQIIETELIQQALQSYIAL